MHLTSPWRKIIGLALLLAPAIALAAPPVVSTTLQPGRVGYDYNERIFVVTSSSPVTSYGASGLPAGLSINASTGAITGRPTGSAGTYPVVLSATNADGTGAGTASLRIEPGPTAAPVINMPDVLTTERPADGTSGGMWVTAVNVSNFPSRITVAGLPAGASQDGGVGSLINWGSAAPGTYSLTITAINPIGSATKTMRVNIHPTIVQYQIERKPLNIGETFRAFITYDGPVTVAGRPTLRLSIALGTRAASYVSGSGGTRLTFEYVTAPGDFTTLGMIGGIDLNGGAVAHAGSGLEARLSKPRSHWSDTSGDFAIYAPPVIVSATDATTTVGVPFSYTITAQHSPTTFAARGLPAGLALNTTTGRISGTPTVTGTFTITLEATNVYVSTPGTATLRLTINPATPLPPPPPAPPPPPPPAPPPPPPTPPAPPPPPPAPTIAPQTIEFVSPVSTIVMGQPVLLSATASSGLPVTFTVVSGNATISGNALTVTGPGPVVVRASQAGSADFSPTSTEVTITGAQRATQAITLAALSTELMSDRPFALNATSSSGLPVTFEVLSGPATVSANVLRPTAAAGTVTLRAVQAGTEFFAPTETTRVFNILAASRLINLSSRVMVREGDASRSLIAGFVVSGSAPKYVLVRAVGPALANFGVGATVANPRLRIFDQASRVIAENDDWNGAELSAAFARLGAFGLPVGSRDAALLVTLPPGAYTLHLESVVGEGVGLVEIYDASDVPALETQQVINISTRAQVGAGEAALTAGFVVTGDVPKRVLIRGIGPALAAFGVAGALADPVLTVYRGSSVVAQNDNWQAPAPGSAEIAPAAAAVGAFALANGSADAALILTLSPGAYTATLSGVNDTTGAGLIEIYQLSP